MKVSWSNWKHVSNGPGGVGDLRERSPEDRISERNRRMCAVYRKLRESIQAVPFVVPFVPFLLCRSRLDRRPFGRLTLTGGNGITPEISVSAR